MNNNNSDGNNNTNSLIFNSTQGHFTYTNAEQTKSIYPVSYVLVCFTTETNGPLFTSAMPLRLQISFTKLTFTN